MSFSEIFVFGSNLQGRHGKGAAKEAVERYGAIYGQAVGLQGNSYAIPTKATPYYSLPLATIRKFVNEFIEFAHKNNNLMFVVTPIGCGLAGFKPEQIAPMFKNAPANVQLPQEFIDVLQDC